MIKNRIEKNLKKLLPWSQRHRIEAYRVYDRDIPEFPYIVDVYKNYLVIQEKLDLKIDREEKKSNHRDQLLNALLELFKVDHSHVIWKSRQMQKGDQQYERLSQNQLILQVRETQALFKVNLTDYLDTGLFLDHRPMRQTIFQQAQGGKKVLNLFCYTGAVSVMAALGGGFVTSVDMSATYLDWAKDNFKLNQIPIPNHPFIQTNVLEFLAEAATHEKFDLIFLDPPTFSNSKRMQGTFEVERDQESLIEQTMRFLKPDGVLYFSTNKRKFSVIETLLKKYNWRDISAKTIPMDFHDQKIHHCYEVRYEK